VRLPGHEVKKTGAAAGLAPLAERLTALYRDAALQPPRPVEAAAALGADAKELDRALDLLVRGGTLLRIKDLIFDRSAVETLRTRLTAYLQERKEITPQDWKDMVGASRKFAIPLAEHFDAEKLTMRVGEVRKLRGR
jgi:selenocysteine-specific elongation factor